VRTANLAAIRVAIADDHSVVRRGLRQVLDAEGGFDVVAEASDLESARRMSGGITRTCWSSI
jgi:DNA-binding NarL/FixJ family response regulator